VHGDPLGAGDPTATRGRRRRAAQAPRQAEVPLSLRDGEDVDKSEPSQLLRDRVTTVVASLTFRWGEIRVACSVQSQFEADVARLSGLDPGDAAGFQARLNEVIDNTLTADYWSITLPNELATSASKSPALMAYIAALNILDADALLSTGKVRSRLDPTIIAKKGIERHHLFPRAYLRNKLNIKETKRIKQIANMALVEWSDNIAISDPRARRLLGRPTRGQEAARCPPRAADAPPRPPVRVAAPQSVFEKE
jgi:hypothetical protein